VAGFRTVMRGIINEEDRDRVLRYRDEAS